MNTGLSTLERQYLNHLTSQLNRMLTIYWVALIPTLSAYFILDRLLSLIFNYDFIAFSGYMPYSSVWLGTCYLVLPFCFAWSWLIWMWSSPAARTIIALLWIILLSCIGYLTKINTLPSLSLNPTGFFLLVSVLIIFLFPGTFILVSISKTLLQTTAVTLGYIAAFAVVHWVGYLRVFPNFEWAGTTSGWSIDGSIPFTTHVMPMIAGGIAILFMGSMALLHSENIQVKILTRELVSFRRKHQNSF